MILNQTLINKQKRGNKPRLNQLRTKEGVFSLTRIVQMNVKMIQTQQVPNLQINVSVLNSLENIDNSCIIQFLHLNHLVKLQNGSTRGSGLKSIMQRNFKMILLLYCKEALSIEISYYRKTIPSLTINLNFQIISFWQKE